MQYPTTPADETLLWYELGGLYARAAADGRRAWSVGFTVLCGAAALVLISAPLFGTAWAGSFAPLIPVLAGLAAGIALFARRRLRFRKGRKALQGALTARGADASRPTSGGLRLYYDAQLVLLRCEYEFVRERGTGRALRSARLFEAAFGFTPEDGFECGPLNVRPDTEKMHVLRGRWEARLSTRRASSSSWSPSPLGLREDAHYGVFPREMTVKRELATRAAYLAISRRLMRERYGRKGGMSEEVRRRAEKELREYRALAGRS